ncbi:protease HtpX [Candidatus Woesearchaeota archaeon B3_Woes]|nr:MAG: protease HtpX [Candidatus Woesearchaeota archaeon B3_Woes]
MGNQIKTVFLLGLLTALFLWVGNLVGGPSGLTIAIFFALIMNFGSYWFSDKIVLKMYKAKEVKESDEPELYKLVKEIINTAKIPMPKIYIMNALYANAFATGRNPKHSAVAVTKGIIDLLSKEELKGVIAHEISHIKNRDTLIQAVAATIAGVISYVAFMARWVAIFGGRDDDSSGLEFLVLAILTPILAAIIQMAISRSREFIADSSAAKLLHSGEGLATALEKLENSTKHISLRKNSQTQVTAHLFITNPFRGGNLLKLFSTHPQTKERIRRLKNMNF